MRLPDKIFKPEKYTHKEYLLWKGDWELVNGYPYAMAPSHNRNHQWFSGKFIQKMSNELDDAGLICNCTAYSELDWVIDTETVIRPDCMVVCGKFKEEYLTFTPTIVVEVSSKSTKLRDRNTKYNLYELQGVKYYIIADTDKKTVEAFELKGKKYIPKKDTAFKLTQKCTIDFDIYSLWESM